MRRLLGEADNVPTNVLGCSVVVVQHRRYLVAYNVPSLADADVQGE